jgi:hypothetical protein
MSTKIDALVLELLKENVLPILAWNRKLQIYLLTDLADDEEGGPPRVEYQVSNGLPGARTESEDFATFAEARAAFEARALFEREKARQTTVWDAVAGVWRGPPPDEVGENGDPR